MEEQIELIVSCDGLLTSLVRVFILLETLLQIGLAFGMIELFSSVVFLPNGRIIGKYLSSLRKLDHIIAPKERFETQL